MKCPRGYYRQHHDSYLEDDRLHLQHWAVKLAFGSNFDAPIEKELEEGTNVLDSACGPATWTLEMANAFPNSTFYGTDISPRFPEQIKPGNCKFLVHNILEEPPFEENFFGYIHERLVVLGIKQADWPKLLKNLTKTLKPGGWLELTEVNQTAQFCRKVMTAAGLDLDIESSLPNLVSEAGLINIQKRQVDAPINHSGKMGQLFWENFKEGFSAVRAAFTKFHPEFEEPGAFEKFIDGIGEDSRKSEWTISFTRVIGQKPLLNDS
ncbi:S-adenosyl-L-methionine-dependent methyltransferase [Dichotomocladium elegans]|nr:S-adenosyl-L-methionine-dependent methyltransferase [Dichotomocladium elegans]